MKKDIILYTFLILVSFNCLAQTNEERSKIISNYNFENIKILKSKLKEEQIKKEKRISEYLKTHKEAKRKFKSENKNYSIYDIQDGKPIYRTTTNSNSAKATKTDQLYTGGSLNINVEGENMIIGVWDEESVLETHDEFKDDQIIPETRIVYPEFNGNPFTGTTSKHATHVAGTLIAKGANIEAKGMAPKATLHSFDWLNDNIEALDEASKGLLISNHSYGTPIFNENNAQLVNAADIGNYGSEAKTWDEIAYDAPYYLAVNSAGNDGNNTYSGGLATNFDKLTGNKTAKNNLVVANANPIVLQSGIVLRINDSSSQGPTDDFRIKPDISGDGTDVFSPINTSDSSYGTESGSSMASPNVAGSLLLLQEYYNQLNSNYLKAATLKGLVCHTALDDNSKIGPDPIYGWGLLDTEKAAELIKDDSNGSALISELSLNNGDSYTYEFTAAQGTVIKATICWTDPAGTASSSPNNVLSPRLVNDLDLRIEHNGTTYEPWKLDKTNVTLPATKGDNDVDNIERVDMTTNTSGTYTLTVTHKGTLTNGKQDFSLILNGNNIVLSAKEINKLKAKIWPNPASNILNINYEATNTSSLIEIYSIEGKRVFYENNKTNTHTIDVSQMKPGMYFLSITNGFKKHNQKIIIN